MKIRAHVARCTLLSVDHQNRNLLMFLIKTWTARIAGVLEGFFFLFTLS